MSCAGAGYTLVLQNGQTFTVATTAGSPITIPAASLGTSFAMRGTNNEFEVDTASFGLRNWAFTGAPNPEGLTSGQRMVMFASKQPDRARAGAAGVHAPVHGPEPDQGPRPEHRLPVTGAGVGPVLAAPVSAVPVSAAGRASPAPDPRRSRARRSPPR
jgi:hypothetical protein